MKVGTPVRIGPNDYYAPEIDGYVIGHTFPTGDVLVHENVDGDRRHAYVVRRADVIVKPPTRKVTVGRCSKRRWAAHLHITEHSSISGGPAWTRWGARRRLARVMRSRSRS